MVSAGVCFGGKWRLHFIPNKTKVNAKLCVATLLPELVQECRSVLQSGFILQQDGTPAHTAKLAHDWIATNCSEFIGKDEWPLNSLDLNPLDYHVSGAMLECYKSFQPKPENMDELKKVLQLIWDQLPQNSINKAILSFPKTSGLCESWRWTLQRYAKMNYLSDFGICNNSQCFSTMKITSCCWLFRAELKIWHRKFIQP